MGRGSREGRWRGGFPAAPAAVARGAGGSATRREGGQGAGGRGAGETEAGGREAGWRVVG